MRTVGAGTIAAAMFAAGVMYAQRPPAEHPRYERDIHIAGPGAQRLAVDLPLLIGDASADARIDLGPMSSGLADLRIVDRNGANVIYTMRHAPSPQLQWTSGALVALHESGQTGGVEADFQTAGLVDGIRIQVAGVSPAYLERLLLEGSADRERWTRVGGVGTLSDSTPGFEHRSEIAVSFAARPFRYVRLTWVDPTVSVITPIAADARQVSGVAALPPLTAAFSAERRPSEPGRSRYHIKLPAPRLPIVALDLTVGGGDLYRHMSVAESRLSGFAFEPFTLGQARVIRLAQDDVPARPVRIPIVSPLESEIDLVIDDEHGTHQQDPPLDLTGVTAVFAKMPWICLDPAPGPLTARYGGPPRPSYGEPSAPHESADVSSLPEARWGQMRRVLETTADVVIGPAPETGADIGGGPFKYSRPIPDGPGGFSTLPLDAAALGHSRGPDARFADVRILDRADRQIPYLIERRDEPLAISLSLQSAVRTAVDSQFAPGARYSTYTLTLPSANLPPSRLVLESAARGFYRNVRLVVVRPADTQRRDPWIEVLSGASWSHSEADAIAPALVLPVPRTDVADLWLDVDEGDNRPLSIAATRLLLPSYRLRFYRPAGASLRLVYGRADLRPPMYDFGFVAPQLAGVGAREVIPTAEIRPGVDGVLPFISPRAFWAFLTVSVTVLLALIVRLVRKAR